MRCSRLTTFGMLLPLGLAAVASAEETLAERRSRLEKMPAVEKDELRRKQQKLLKLDSQEQLRELERQLAGDPNEDRLRKVMLQYHEWLRALTSAERGELLALPEEQRLPKIQEMLQKQDSDRLKELAKESLTPEDVEQVRVWLNEMVLGRKFELLQQLPQEVRDRLAGSDQARTIMFEWLKHTRDRTRTSTHLLTELKVSGEDRQRLVSKLSTKAAEVYKRASNEQAKQTILQNWIFTTFRPNPPTSEELQEFLQRLPPETRDRLENLHPEQMKAELRRRYFDYRRWSDGKRPGPPGLDRPGEHRKGPPPNGPFSGNPDRTK